MPDSQPEPCPCDRIKRWFGECECSDPELPGTSDFVGGRTDAVPSPCCPGFYLDTANPESPFCPGCQY